MDLSLTEWTLNMKKYYQTTKKLLKDFKIKKFR